MSNKVNILVDLNLLFHRWVHYLSARKSEFLTRDEDVIDLVQNVHISLQSDVNKYRGYISRVMIISDSDKKSWRKLIEVGGEKFYKTHKKEEKKFDYQVFLKVINEYCEILKNKGIYHIHFDHAEGDDLLYLISDELYKRGENSIVISSDSDLRQFVKSSDGKFVYVWDSGGQKKLHYVDKILSEKTGITIEEENIGGGHSLEFNGLFDHDTDLLQKNGFDNLLGVTYDVYDIIEPMKFIFVKMLSGDKSDNVPSSYYYPRKNGDLISFTDKRAKDLWDKFSKTHGYDNIEYYVNLVNNKSALIDLACKMQMEVAKPSDKKNGFTNLNDKEIPDICDGILRNLKFVFIHETMFFEAHYKKMIKYVRAVLDDNDYLIQHRERVGQNFGLSLLDDNEKYRFGKGEDSRDFNKKYNY
jgi:5'-3' exonuclease